MIIVPRVLLFYLLCLCVSLSRASQLALLAGTLRTFQRHACDGSSLELSCPNNTSIDILHVNYGDATVSDKMQALCPFIRHEPYVADDGCTFSPLEYSSTQKVVELCHAKRSCIIDVKSSTFTTSEPCPSHQKYLEVAYKCRPAIFINKILCEEEILFLNCGTRAKIAIYSVFFGRTKEGSLKCPQELGVPQGDCQASFASEIVMKQCHGYNSCEVRASRSVFGNPCPQDYKMYMKAVYTCVPSLILKNIRTEEIGEALMESDISPSISGQHLPSDPIDIKTVSDSHNISSEEVERLVAVSDILNCTVTILAGSKHKEVGITTDWMRAVTFISQKKETFVLYFVVGGGGGLLLCLIALALHLWRDREKEKKKRILHDQLTSTYSADFEELDGETGLVPTSMEQSSNAYSSSPPHPVVEQDAVRYYSSPRPAALRCNDTDLILPRSLSRHNQQYLYS